MKTASADLIHLIHSLTQAEKRYCRLALQQKSLKNQALKLQLFDTIYQNSDFDEKQLTSWIASSDYQSSTTSLKHQLKNQLLTALHHYYENNDDQARVYKAFHSARILYQKGLLGACASMLKSLKKEAEQLKFYGLMTEVLSLEKYLAPDFKQFSKRLDHLQLLYQEYEACLDNLRSENDFWIIFNRLYQYHIRQSYTPVKDEYQEVKALLKGEKPRFSRKPRTFKARLDYYQALALSAFMNGNTKQAFRFNRAFLRYFEAHPKQGHHFIKRYIAIFNNYLIDGFSLGKYDTVEQGIEYLKGYEGKGILKEAPGMKVEIFRLTTLLELNLHLARNHFQKGQEFSRAIKGKLRQFGDQLPDENFISIHYLCAYLHFIGQNLQEALDWVLPILENYQISDVPVINIFRHAQMLSLLIHYELGNADYLAYALTNMQKQLKKEGLENGIFGLTIRHLKQLIDGPALEANHEAWQQYLETIQALDLQWTLFDFEGWARSHLESASMAEVMKH